jgi:hypothetical protein
MKLSLKTLQEKQACQDQVELFEKLFGQESEVTEEACLSVVDKFDWDWAAHHLLTSAAWAKYYRAAELAWWTEYLRETIYWRLSNMKRTSYYRAAARAFARAYNSDLNLTEAKEPPNESHD